MHGNGETLNMEPYQRRDLVMIAYLSQITKGKQYVKYDCFLFIYSSLFNFALFNILPFCEFQIIEFFNPEHKRHPSLQVCISLL